MRRQTGDPWAADPHAVGVRNAAPLPRRSFFLHRHPKRRGRVVAASQIREMGRLRGMANSTAMAREFTPRDAEDYLDGPYAG